MTSIESSRRPRAAASLLAWGMWCLLLVARAQAQVWEVDARLLVQDPLADSGVFGTSLAVGDFDGDGSLDLAVGSQGWSNHVGSVTFFHGAKGSRALPLWDEVHGNGTEYLGWSVVAGDFDHDGKDEIAVGAPFASVAYQGGTVNQAGVVHVYQYQSGCGCFQSIQTISQADAASFFPPAYGTGFGSVLAVGKWNGDLFDDLAVGVPSQTIAGHGEAGAVQVFYGGDAGLDVASAQGFRAGANGVFGSPADSDDLGYALASGDFDGDGHPDLAIGTPGRTVSGKHGAGAVYVLRGSATGLVTTGQQLLTQADFAASADTASLGWALAAGYFLDAPAACLGGGCYADLAIGAPFWGLDHTTTSVGAVVVAYGGASGLETSGATILMRDIDGGTIKSGEEFGRTLAAGALDPVSGKLGLSPMDLAIGAPVAGMSGFTNAGFVDLTFGAAGGLASAEPAQNLHTRPGFPVGTVGAYDGFGGALAIADFDGDGWGDLAVSITGADVNGVNASGAVEVFFGAMFADGFESGATAAWSAALP